MWYPCSDWCITFLLADTPLDPSRKSTECIRMCILHPHVRFVLVAYGALRFRSLACVWPRAFVFVVHAAAAYRRVRLVAGRDDAEPALGALRNVALQVRRYRSSYPYPYLYPYPLSSFQPVPLCSLCARVARNSSELALLCLFSSLCARRRRRRNSAQPGEYGVDPPAARGRLEHSALGGQRPRPRRHRRVRLGLLRRYPRTRPEYARL